MKLKMNSSNSYLFHLLLLGIFILIIILIFYSKNKTKSIPKINTSPKKSMEIVISRYNEDLLWTTKPPFNKYKFIVYNKGDNEDYHKSNVLRSYNIKNQGKCDHTYLYHIVHNYDHLAEIVVFLPGCLDIYFKFSKAKLLIEQIEKYNQAFFIIDYEATTNILDEYYYLKMDDYKSMTQENLLKNELITFRKSKIRPFGKWYKQNFNFDIQYISLFGIMSFDKKDIYNHDKTYYYHHMKSLEGATNDELSHYYEKAWQAVIFPMKNTNIFNYTNSITNTMGFIVSKYSKILKYKFNIALNNSMVGPVFWNTIYFINQYTYFP